MLIWSHLLIILGIILHKSTAQTVDPQKLCKGLRYGTLVPNPDDCNSFYVCQFIIQLTKCDVGLHFDRRLNVCNWPENADCDWVDIEDGSSEEKVPPSRPDKPDSGGSVVDPNTPSPVEEKPLIDSNEQNNGEQSKPSEGANGSQPSEDKSPESKEPEKSESGNGITVGDMITPSPQNPEIDAGTSLEENHDNQPNGPSTEDDVLINEVPTRNPTVDDFITPSPSSSSENQENQQPAVDDILTPIPNSPESPEPTPELPKPDHPQQPPPPTITEEVDQNSSENHPAIDENKPQRPTPPNIDKNTNEPDTETPDDLELTSGYKKNHWNLIASIVSLESSHTDGFINHPTVGAHSPETGFPIDPMLGYNPKNVKCLHSGLYFLPHPTDCQKYIICAYRHLHLHTCGEGVIWNHKRQQCELKGNSQCYSRNADSEDTTELVTPFIDYESHETSKKPITRKPKTTKLPATNQGLKNPKCPTMRQVYLANLSDCNKYFICIMGKPVMMSCPNEMHWDAIGEFCGKPSEVRCGRRYQ